MNDEAFKRKLEKRALAANKRNSVDNTTENTESFNKKSFKKRIIISCLTPLMNTFALILLFVAFIGSFCKGSDCNWKSIGFMQTTFSIISLVIAAISLSYNNKTLTLAKKYNKSLGLCRVLIYLSFVFVFIVLGISSFFIINLIH